MTLTLKPFKWLEPGPHEKCPTASLYIPGSNYTSARNCRTTLRFCRPSDAWALLWVTCTRHIFLRQPLGSIQSLLSLATKILYRCEIARFNTPSYIGCLTTPRYRCPKTKSNCNNVNHRKRYIFTSLHKYKAELSLK